MELNINNRKAKFMIISRAPEAFQSCNLTFSAKAIQTVNKFKYFGPWFFEDGAADKEVKYRIE